MQKRHHRAVTEAAIGVAQKGRVQPYDPAWVLGLMDGCTYPDEVHDVSIYLLGKERFELFGLGLQGLEHFCVPTGTRTYRGYSWPRDPTAKFLELPDVPVHWTGQNWISKLWERPLVIDPEAAQAWAIWSPMHQLLGVEGINKAFDELTYSCSASVAQWLEVLLTLQRWNGRRVPYRRGLVAGSIAHLAQDGCTKPHATGVMVSGHATYEAEAWEQWLLRHANGFQQDRVYRGSYQSARSLVESCSLRGRNADTVQCSDLAVRATAQLIQALADPPS